MHWFWRATIAVVPGSAFGLSFYYIGQLWGKLWPTWGMEIVTLLMFPLATFISVAYFARLTRQFGPRTIDTETRCRKCGYILRGIPDPRCSECGEWI